MDIGLLGDGLGWWEGGAVGGLPVIFLAHVGNVQQCRSRLFLCSRATLRYLTRLHYVATLINWRVSSLRLRPASELLGVQCELAVFALPLFDMPSEHRHADNAVPFMPPASGRGDVHVADMAKATKRMNAAL